MYWQRMKDIRVKDNMALAHASAFAQAHNKNLVILHVLSPGDFKAHDRAAVRIDFVLRNLRMAQEELDTYNIPLAIRTMTPRLSIPEKVLALCKEWDASHIFANLEYEVDELRRDIKLAEQAPGHHIQVHFSHDYVLVKPGIVVSKQDKPYSVFSPFHRAWAAIMSPDLASYSKDYPTPNANSDDIRKDAVLGKLVEEKVPESVEGFEIGDEDLKTEVHKLFPAGTEAAEEMLRRFMETKSRKGQYKESPLADGAEEDVKKSRVALYSDSRNYPNIDGGSRLS